jgi:hypothetical protein
VLAADREDRGPVRPDGRPDPAHLRVLRRASSIPLVSGVLEGVDGILQGIESLTTKGKPVIDALGGSFAIIGKSVGNAISIISGDSGDAASPR